MPHIVANLLSKASHIFRALSNPTVAGHVQAHGAAIRASGHKSCEALEIAAYALRNAGPRVQRQLGPRTATRHRMPAAMSSAAVRGTLSLEKGQKLATL
jgi:hypothetical protein